MKRKLIWPILLGIAWRALGYVVEIVIGIMVLTVGAFIIYKLVRLIHTVLPPNSAQTTNSVAVYYSTPSGPLSASPAFAAQGAAVMTSQGLPLQYGISSIDGLPWVCLGTNQPVTAPTNQASYSIIYTIQNDTNGMDIVINVGGKLTRDRFDAASGVDANWPVVVAIQSSTNLVDWSTIYTDSACVLDSVNGFTDPNPPSTSNFYRINYN